MSERLFAWLLRLYPGQFREAYGEEALQLFRDRARDERGWRAGLRLWVDLIGDLAVSIPREYRYTQPRLAGGAAGRRGDGMPCFHVLEDETPRLGTVVFAGLLSVAVLSGVSVSIGHAGNYGPLRGSVADWLRFRQVAPGDGRASAPPSGDGGAREIATGPIGRPARQRPSQGGETRLSREAGGEGRPEAAERHLVMDGVIQNLKAHYVDPEVAQKMTEALLAHQRNGDDDRATEPAAFAELLTRQMREVSHDPELVVVYVKEGLRAGPAGPTAESVARYRKVLEQENCTFRKVEILPHHIGYLKIDSFPDPAFCESTARAAMASLNHADALIFDLRDNRGGYGPMASLLAGYLFDHPEYMYSPRSAPTVESWTRSPVAGSSLADKPVYVLTSGTTISAAEQFTYDLKMLRRVTLVGETTRGSAHAGVFHRIDDHFGIGITEVRAINPYAKTDWEGVGIEPDVKVKSAEALETAVKLAESRLGKR